MSYIQRNPSALASVFLSAVLLFSRTPAIALEVEPADPVAAPDAAAALVHVNASLEEVLTLVRAQSQQLSDQRTQIDREQQEIDELRARLLSALPGSDNALVTSPTELSLSARASKDADSLNSRTRALRLAPSAADPVASSSAGITTNTATTPHEEPEEGPLSIRLGRAKLTPGGWVDFTSIYRSTDVGSGLGTSFASIPYNNSVAGGLSETRFSAQGSRITFRADEDFGKTKVFGYAEADFNGYLPANAYVSSNADSLRLRVYFLDVARGRWELLSGQSWSLMTPNRVAVSPFLSEIYNTIHLDSNYQVGLTYARQAQIRAVYHFSNKSVLALSAENPEQFSGSAVTFPTLFNTSQTDLNSASGGATATPNLHPDVIAKFATDPSWGDRRWHFEATGLLTSATVNTPASVTKTTAAKDSREGGGISVSANLELERRVHFIGSAFWSDGGGRYIGGSGPGFVVAQGGTTKSPFAVQMIHSGSATAGLELQATARTLLSFTYSGAYFGRSYSVDPSTHTLIGYGYSGSANSNNRGLQEGTIASQTTLWKHPSYGAIQVLTQSSYITRAPWYVLTGAPRNAHVFAGYANLRYVLP